MRLFSQDLTRLNTIALKMMLEYFSNKYNAVLAAISSYTESHVLNTWYLAEQLRVAKTLVLLVLVKRMCHVM